MTPPKRISCARSLAADLLSGKFHVDDAQGADFDLAESGISIETRAKTSDSGAGVDVAIAQSVKSLTETDRRAARERRGRAGQDDVLDRRRRRRRGDFGIARAEIGDFWKYVVAHIEDAAAPADLKQRFGRRCRCGTIFRRTPKFMI